MQYVNAPGQEYVPHPSIRPDGKDAQKWNLHSVTPPRTRIANRGMWTKNVRPVCNSTAETKTVELALPAPMAQRLKSFLHLRSLLFRILLFRSYNFARLLLITLVAVLVTVVVNVLDILPEVGCADPGALEKPMRMGLDRPVVDDLECLSR